jgi:hypothetical protein
MDEDFVKVSDKGYSSLTNDSSKSNGEKICLSNVNGKYYAIGNVCTHMGGPLAEGVANSIFLALYFYISLNSSVKQKYPRTDCAPSSIISLYYKLELHSVYFNFNFNLLTQT